MCILWCIVKKLPFAGFEPHHGPMGDVNVMSLCFLPHIPSLNCLYCLLLCVYLMSDWYATGMPLSPA